MSNFKFDQKKFIQSVLDFMKKNGISHRDFAELAGTSPMTLYRLLEGTNEIKISTILKLEKAMEKYIEEDLT